MNRTRVHIVAKALCEIEGKDWATIMPPDRDRYLRGAILIDYRIEEGEIAVESTEFVIGHGEARFPRATGDPSP